MNTTSPIDDLRQAFAAYMGEPCPDPASTALDDLTKAIDRFLEADTSISWLDCGVRRTKTRRAGWRPQPVQAEILDLWDTISPRVSYTDETSVVGRAHARLDEMIHDLAAPTADASEIHLPKPSPEEEANLDAKGAVGGPDAVADLHARGYAVSFIRQMSRWGRQALLMHLQLEDRVRQVERCPSVESDLDT